MESIGLIGTGRLGICTALILEKAGFNVICYDVNEQTRQAINSRNLESPEKGVSDMLRNAKNICAKDCLEDLLSLDVLFCIVPTPSLSDGSYNHQYLEDVANSIIKHYSASSRRILLNICCTTMPGYCDTLQKKFDEANIPIDVCYNPEFIAQGDILNGFLNPDILLIGEANERAGEKLVNIYKSFVKTEPKICRMKRQEAEITKIAINCFITTKISFANTIGDLCIHNSLNPERVLQAIGGDSRIGTKYFRWGHGFGGPCFPRDNRALCLYSQQQGIQNRIGEATDMTNNKHLEFLVNHLCSLSKETGKSFLFRDLAYKPGTTILEESQNLFLAQRLELEGFTVYVQESDAMKEQLQKLFPHAFLFLDKNADVSNYILIDHTLKGIY